MLYLPRAVNEMTSAPDFRVSTAFPAAMAPFTNPCGVNQMWSWRSSAAANCGAGPLGPMLHALSPFTCVFCC